MHRRTVLNALWSLSLSATLSPAAARKSPPLAAPGQRRFIDVHCHFFNASDLPIKGFLQRVVFADYTSAQNASIASLSVWRGMTAKLADYIVRRNAPSPQAELNVLRDAETASARAPSAARSATRSLSKAAGARPDAQDALTDTFQSNDAEGAAKPQTRTLNQTPNDQDAKAFTDFVLNEMAAQDASGERGRTPSMRAAPAPGSSSRGIFQTIAGHIQSGRSIFSRYFAWATMLGDYRESIAKTYFALYDPKKTRLILATPALVDYNFWLQDQSPSSLADQIELMAFLSLRLPHPAHGFAPFDPLREVRRGAGETSSLSIVQNAVLNRGFLGVKLYSPMGFRPLGNAENGLMFPAHAAMADRGFGLKLDAALEKLYAWCEAEEVPILAHTTDSQSAGPEFGARAEPKFWAAVLRKYPKLRINLAHFGNFTQAFGGSGDPVAQFDKTWEREIGGFVTDRRLPNVYADISYFYWVLDGSASTENVTAAKAMFRQYIQKFDPKVERLMFGTDWNMTGRAPGFEGYVDNVEAFFRDAGLNEMQLDNLFHRNAVRFLALSGNTKTMTRLGKFYRENNRSVPSFG